MSSFESGPAINRGNVIIIDISTIKIGQKLIIRLIALRINSVPLACLLINENIFNDTVTDASIISPG
jgi:hypothetical protein